MITQDHITRIAMQLEAIAAQIAHLQAQCQEIPLTSARRSIPTAPRFPRTMPPSAPSTRQSGPTQSVTVRVAPELCRGCGLCVRMAPRTFALDPMTGQARLVNPRGDSEQVIRAVIANCPTGAVQYGT